MTRRDSNCPLSSLCHTNTQNTRLHERSPARHLTNPSHLQQVGNTFPPGRWDRVQTQQQMQLVITLCETVLFFLITLPVDIVSAILDLFEDKQEFATTGQHGWAYNWKHTTTHYKLRLQTTAHMVKHDLAAMCFDGWFFLILYMLLPPVGVLLHHGVNSTEFVLSVLFYFVGLYLVSLTYSFYVMLLAVKNGNDGEDITRADLHAVVSSSMTGMAPNVKVDRAQRSLKAFDTRRTTAVVAIPPKSTTSSGSSGASANLTRGA